jgi:hypothetical protein
VKVGSYLKIKKAKNIPIKTQMKRLSMAPPSLSAVYEKTFKKYKQEFLSSLLLKSNKRSFGFKRKKTMLDALLKK